MRLVSSFAPRKPRNFRGAKGDTVKSTARHATGRGCAGLPGLKLATSKITLRVGKIGIKSSGMGGTPLARLACRAVTRAIAHVVSWLPGFALPSVTAEIFQHIPDAAMRLQWMPQLFIDRDPVRVATPDPGHFHVRGFDQLGHNLLHHGALGDP